MSAINRRTQSFFKRCITGLCAICLIFSTTACQSSDEEPLIHANHDKGMKFGTHIKDIESRQQIRDIHDYVERWGAEQTPEWLAICNTINRKALRKLGFDPQNNLRNRDSGDLKDSCAWEKENYNRRVLISLMRDSIDQLNARENFYYFNTVNDAGRKIYVGKLDNHLSGTKGCGANFRTNNKNYSIIYLTSIKNDDIDKLCQEVVELARAN